ncbi:SIR2 family protein [Bradyrhizobium canariense]|uniref:SIR2 family protein n=1 Tax=Bradyrhizobium canariense TaxID=255045 RepID=UPI001B8A11AC|nr:SIR2 family protein [Bradyrhizobium canariense]MBR0951280.1 SIR2 family protein [Bradyrhizobium canariense]
MSTLDDALARQPRLPRYLCHLYQRLCQRRLNLVTGAGISIDAGVPDWHGLLDRLAAAEEALKTDLGEHRQAGLNPEYLGQIIYHRFKSSCPETNPSELQAATIEHNWGKAIHEAIYDRVPASIGDVVGRHPYLAQLRDVARKVPLVINFNFDDILSDAIGDEIKAGAPGNAMSVTWHPPLTDRVDLTTIYHVNGILPRVSLRKRSPQLIFTEDSFADARARAPGVSAEYIFLRFVQNTMLLVGHSLADSSLKNYLRLNRDKSPANHHYMIFWMEHENKVSASRRQDIFEANLELYNLITIFLTSPEIREFLDVLNLDERAFGERLDSLGEDRRWRYHYYIVGPVAAGKSTLLEQLRCFQTHEEWTRPPPREMYLASTNIDDQEREAIDRFIYAELKEKNRRMHAAQAGFHFMDRAPLDLYAFSKSDSENSKKSEELRTLVTRDQPLQKGEILFIEASPTALVRRNMLRGRSPNEAGSEAYFTEQTESLKKVYAPYFVLSTEQYSAGEVARQVARHVLLHEYRPADLEKIIERYE